MNVTCHADKGGCGQSWALEVIEGHFRKHFYAGTSMDCLNSACTRKITVGELASFLTALDIRRVQATPTRPTTTEIAKVRRFLHTQLDDGTTCPCCAQFAKRYKRKLNSGMARSLLWLSGKPVKFIDVQQTAPDFVLKSAEINKLAWWNLVEAPDGATRRSKGGIWRITDEGLRFASSAIKVPRYAYVYNNRCEKLGGAPIGIREALGNHFDYDEIMRRAD